MINSAKKRFLVSATLGLLALTGVAEAQDFEFRIGGGRGGAYYDDGYGAPRRHRDDGYRDDYGRRPCDAEGALETGRAYGMRRVYIKSFGRRGIVVGGIGSKGEWTAITVSRDPSCQRIG